MADSKQPYIGRFAPSPTGPLHFGSLLAAVASYVDARANGGTWLLRMEDLDPPREPPGAADTILRQLEQLDLNWDGSVLFQSTRLADYAQALQQLRDQGLVYACDCSRQQIKDMGSVYDGRCRRRSSMPIGDYALRVTTGPALVAFDDLIQGSYQQQIETEVGDFVLRRKDGLFAYQLAVVVDDAFQRVTRVIRGYDLIDSTPRQIYLQRLLGYETPRYGHVPVVVNELGQKLSKQHFAAPVDTAQGPALVQLCLVLLGQAPPTGLGQESVSTQLGWAVQHWDIHAVPKLANIPALELN